MTAAGPAQMLLTLAYRPLVEPLPLDDYWMLLLLPLVLAVSIVYKTIRLRDLSRLPRQVLRMSLQIIVFMVMAAVVLKLVTDWI